MNLKDKVVVITGSSRGFGKSLAKAFVAEGSRVIISSRDEKELEQTADQLSTDFFLADVVDPKAVENLGTHALKKYGTIDIWINNAGIQIAPSKVEEVDIDKLHHLFEINCFGYFYGCQSALRQMRKQGQGTIINIGSTASLEGKPGISAYSSAKFAVKGLTESIRQELTDTDIEIYGIYPGGMQTDIYKEEYPTDIKSICWSMMSPQR